MSSRLKILLVEDDQKACSEIINIIDSTEDIELTGVTNNSTKAIEYLKDYLPDAVILDLELHQGYGNGIMFLQEMKNSSLSKVPYILITTNNTSSVTYDYARQLGADFIMSKHQPDYSEKGVVDFLVMMKDIILNRVKNSTGQETESPAQSSKRLTRRIFTELDLIGVSQKAVGHKYLVDAIQIVMGEPVSNICNIIGKKYSKTPASVERAMQNAINRTWRTSDIDDLLFYYTAKINSDRGVPTITEFIYYYANKLNNDL